MTQETAHMPALDPLAVSSDEGEARWWFGTLAVIKTTAAQSGGQLTIIDVTNPPGFEAPLHVHHRDDEGFWILEGNATFQVGERTLEASTGDYLFGPRDIPHRYTAGDSGCRMLFIMVPGGMEDVVRATSEPAASRTLPPPPDEEPDLDAIKAIVKEHGYELLEGSME
jgi:quercetin dioxygenase-like cupin family protein